MPTQQPRPPSSPEVLFGAPRGNLYIRRPGVSEKRLSLTSNGNVRYQLKTSYRDGATHVIFEPPDFMARLAALVPKPRVNLTRFHGVFAPPQQTAPPGHPRETGQGQQGRGGG